MQYNRYAKDLILPFSNVMELKTCYHFKKLTLFRESCFGGIKHPAQHCHPIVMDTLRKTFCLAFNDDMDFPTKIYVTRRGVKRSPFENEGDIESVLEKNGYFILEPEKYSPDMQIKFSLMLILQCLVTELG
jgi:capsular polysaccharide biosynthesis protein